MYHNNLLTQKEKNHVLVKTIEKASGFDSVTRSIFVDISSQYRDETTT